MNLEEWDRVLRAVYSDPKFRAEVEWLSEYGVASQLGNQWPRDEMEAYVRTGQHVAADRTVSLVLHEMPDFDWWEPRYDQPWRRRQARLRDALA